jgi:hypothetical protein
LWALFPADAAEACEWIGLENQGEEDIEEKRPPEDEELDRDEEETHAPRAEIEAFGESAADAEEDGIAGAVETAKRRAGSARHGRDPFVPVQIRDPKS